MYASFASMVVRLCFAIASEFVSSCTFLCVEMVQFWHFCEDFRFLQVICCGGCFDGGEFDFLCCSAGDAQRHIIRLVSSETKPFLKRRLSGIVVCCISVFCICYTD